MLETLLVVDDSLTIQRVVKLAFTGERLDVVAVNTGKKAIEQIKAQPPAIVLADTRMPDRSGYEIAEFVKASPECSGIPVVLMTGAFEVFDERRAHAAGYQAVLVKPLEPGKLLSTVRELLGHHTRPPAVAPIQTKQVEANLIWPANDDTPNRLAKPEDGSGDSPLTAVLPPVSVSPAPDSAKSAMRDETSPPLMISDELVDRLSDRVIARLSDRVVSQTTTDIVTRVAERLVAEEIERLKSKLR